MDIKENVDALRKALKEDKGLFMGYQANIATNIFDEISRQRALKSGPLNMDELHKCCNDGAKMFLKMFIGNSQ